MLYCGRPTCKIYLTGDIANGVSFSGQPENAIGTDVYTMLATVSQL